MKVIYDTGLDVINIEFSNEPIVESDQEKPGFIIDYDEKGNPVSIEILQASKRMSEPNGVHFSSINTQQIARV
ncbi:MAG TPA: DUF2283 domain-containing protein [Candidatus Kapabacteria bacterium]